MSAFLIRRLLRFVVVCIGVSIVTFSILHASGDPVALIMPEAPEADRAKLREALGLSDPLPTQFVRFVANAARGEFGKSFFHAATVVVFLGQSMPVFWIGIMLMLLFAVQWRLLPVSGWDSWSSVVLPSVTLGAFTTPLFMRIIRSSMLEVINLDYVRTARAKGLSEWLVICRHALRNAALPIVTVIGLQFGLLLGGAVLTETVFAVPGVGRLLVRAIVQLDFPIVQAGVFLLAIIIVSVNVLVDVLYVYLNPTIRLR